ncbi:9411_t:CDS:2 [Gigaspora margarita]|uniref:9411_t:CDS:1 n=1 Tax=Gigaspora margarita TaxID=4874 RepID=A0ABN7VS97_GIGMA|nr:9411_t:CDS:2 [Gigaspora margarita]
MVAASKVAQQQPLSSFGNAVAGALGALFALSITYPLDIVKTRLQVQSKSTHTVEYYESTLDAITKIFKAEGVFGLYTGLPSGLIGVASTNFAYFYWYSFIRTRYQQTRSTTSLSTVEELIIGALAGALAQIFTIPVSVVTTRQQTSIITERKALIETANEIISEDGITGLWKGLGPSLILCVNPAITYGAFERFKDIMLKRNFNLTPGLIFLLGALSKTIATVVTYPYIMAKVRLQWKPPKKHDDIEDEDQQMFDIDDQKRKAGTKTFNNKNKSAIGILMNIRKSDGFLGWYKGMQAQILKAVFSQAILFYAKEYTTLYTIFLFSLISRLRSNRKLE